MIKEARLHDTRESRHTQVSPTAGCPHFPHASIAPGCPRFPTPGTPCQSPPSMAYGCCVPGRLYDAIPCGIAHFTVSDPPRFVFVNKEGCAILGYENEEELRTHVGNNAFEHLLPSDLPLANRTLQTLSTHQPTYDFHNRFRRADGTLCWMRGTVALVDERAKPPVAQAAFVDVTSEHEERYVRDRDRYVSVLCSAFDEVYEIDTALDTCRLVHSVFRSKREGHAVPISEALAMWKRFVTEEESWEHLVEAVKSFYHSRQIQPLVLTYRLALETKTAWCQSTFLRMGDRGILCCHNDVTERMNREDAAISRAVGDVVARLPVGIGVYALRGDGIYPLYVSDQVCKMFGYTCEEYCERIANGLPMFAEKDVRSILDVADPETIRTNGIAANIDAVRKDGSSFVVRLRGTVAQAPTGEYALYAALLDVTEEQRIRREASWQNERYRILSELTHAISFDYDSENDEVLLYMDVGNGMEAQVITHYLENLATKREGIIHPDSIGPVCDLFRGVSREGKKHATLDFQADYFGTGFQWFRANLFVINDEGGAWHLVGLIEDIEGERELQRQAEFDLMTGVTNHATTVRLVVDALKDPLVRACSVFVVLDVDDFKNVNDQCGHIKGDELLRHIGELISNSCRTTDVVGRVGGDEFVMLLKGMPVETALSKLEDIRVKVVDLTESMSGLDEVSVSMGVYAVQPTDQTYDDVFEKADKALYASKHAGKNRVTIYA